MERSATARIVFIWTRAIASIVFNSTRAASIVFTCTRGRGESAALVFTCTRGRGEIGSAGPRALALAG